MLWTLGRDIRLRNVRWKTALTFGQWRLFFSSSLRSTTFRSSSTISILPHLQQFHQPPAAASAGGRSRVRRAILLLTACAEPIYRAAIPGSSPSPDARMERNPDSQLLCRRPGRHHAHLLLLCIRNRFLPAGKPSGAWAPADIPYSELLNTRFPWVFVLLMGFFPAVSEEWMFRAFSIPFLERLLRHRWIAILLASFIWASGMPLIPTSLSTLGDRGGYRRPGHELGDAPVRHPGPPDRALLHRRILYGLSVAPLRQYLSRGQRAITAGINLIRCFSPPVPISQPGIFVTRHRLPRERRYGYAAARSAGPRRNIHARRIQLSQPAANCSGDPGPGAWSCAPRRPASKFRAVHHLSGVPVRGGPIGQQFPVPPWIGPAGLPLCRPSRDRSDGLAVQYVYTAAGIRASTMTTSGTYGIVLESPFLQAAPEGGIPRGRGAEERAGGRVRAPAAGGHAGSRSHGVKSTGDRTVFRAWEKYDLAGLDLVETRSESQGTPRYRVYLAGEGRNTGAIDEARARVRIGVQGTGSEAGLRSTRSRRTGGGHASKDLVQPHRPGARILLSILLLAAAIFALAKGFDRASCDGRSRSRSRRSAWDSS